MSFITLGNIAVTFMGKFSYRLYTPLYKSLKIMQRSAELLDQENSVVVVDQAICQLAQRLKWNKPDEFNNVVIVMGVPCFPELFGSTRSVCGRIWMARHS